MKKIVFICGSLEKGKDGVGDYTRRLSAELIRTGNTAKIIALNDRHVPTPLEGFQNEEDISVPVLRLPETSPWNARMEASKKFISELQPHFLSLQYVPFSFDKRGLPAGVARKLKKISNGAKWNIMFHELWIGMDEQASLKHRMIGYLQKQVAKNFIGQLSPSIIHTQTKLYQFMLKRLGQDAILLPLFGNIPVYNTAKTGFTDSDSTLDFVLFGGIHFGAPVREFVEEIAAYASDNYLRAKMTFIGSNGAELEMWLTECDRANVPVHALGKQSPQKISEVLLKSDYGVTTTPIILTEKSGSVAAMREHRLPVICASRKWMSRVGFTFVPDESIYEYRKNTLKPYLQQPHSARASISLSVVANQFINDLT